MADLLHSDSFWVSVAFFIFVILSFKKGKELILNGIDKRIANITNNINDAKKIRLDAENNLKEVEKNLKELEISKDKTLEEAKKESEILKNEILSEEKNNKEKLKKQLTERIEQSKNQVIKDIKKLSTEISVKSIKEILKKQKRETNENDMIIKSISKIVKNKETGKKL